jgi:hypothetical protein
MIESDSAKAPERTDSGSGTPPDRQWVAFPGGELEGERPRTLCAACRATAGNPSARRAHAARRTLCFQCYRAAIDRRRALEAAGGLDTASAERFQVQLPFEPVNRPRLEMLKVQRTSVRTEMSRAPIARFADRRRQAQIAARRALQRMVGDPAPFVATPDRARAIAAAIHAAELQLPESWLPFVVGR